MSGPPPVVPRRCVGVLWSGARDEAAAAAAVWVAEAEAGRVVRVAAGRSRDEVVDDLCADVLYEPETVIGFDVPLVLPAGVMEAVGWATAGVAWRWAARWVGAGADPRALPDGVRDLPDAGRRLHLMARLPRLCDAGIAVVPVDGPRLPMAVEVTPDGLAGVTASAVTGLAGDALRAAGIALALSAAGGDPAGPA